MKKVLKTIAIIVACGLIAVVAVSWWYLDADDVDLPQLPGKERSGSLEHEGLTRTWNAYIPSTVADAPPVLLLLHGSRGSGELFLQSSFHSFNVTAERGGFLAVYPDGFEEHWNDCRGSASYTANTRDIDDVGFLRKLVQQLTLEYGVDTGQVYVAGHSNGGHMAFRMGFEAPELVAGIGAIGANLPVVDNLDCERSAEAVATIIINGTEDPVNPFAGGLVSVFGENSRGEVLSSRESAQYWANLAGYQFAPQHSIWPERAPDDDTRVESLLWSGPGQPPVVLVTVTGGGHTLPHPVFRLPRVLGPTSHEFDTAELIWAFFDGQPFIPVDG